MNKAVPWSIKGVDFDARTAAKEAARRAGMTLGEWLNSVIADQAAENGIDPEEIGEDERVAAVRSRLERMSPAGASQQAGGLRRRSDRPGPPRVRAPEPDYETEYSGNEEYFDRPQHQTRRMRAPAYGREIPFAQPSRFAGYDPHDGDRLPYRSAPGAEALLDEAVRSFERRARRDSAETSAALDTVARRLESIEGRLHRQRDVEPQPDRTLDLVARRLESIEDQLEASRAAPAPAPATDDILEKVISRIETRIESIAAREESAILPPRGACG